MKHLCTPALIYLIIACISVIINIVMKHDWKIILFQLFCIFIWTWVLNVICNSGYPTISWILILIPFISFLFKIK